MREISFLNPATNNPRIKKVEIPQETKKIEESSTVARHFQDITLASLQHVTKNSSPLKQRSEQELKSASLIELTDKTSKKLSDNKNKIEELNREPKKETSSFSAQVTTIAFENRTKTEEQVEKTENSSLGEFIYALKKDMNPMSKEEKGSTLRNESSFDVNSQTRELETLNQKLNNQEVTLDYLSSTNKIEKANDQQTTKLLERTIADIEQTHIQLESIKMKNEIFLNKTNFEEKNTEPALTMEQAENLAAEIVSRDFPDPVRRAQERMTPDAVSQLLL